MSIQLVQVSVVLSDGAVVEAGMPLTEGPANCTRFENFL